MEFSSATYIFTHLLLKANVEQEVVFNKGELLTSSGPAEYDGCILDNPHLVWSEDIWSEDRHQEVLARLREQEVDKKVSSFWRLKYESNAGRFWNDFYVRNTDHFYKDRHYLHIVFPELDPAIPWQFNACDDADHTPLRLFEVGCGVGNAIIPLLEMHSRLHVHAVDFAKSAVAILRSHPLALLQKTSVEPYSSQAACGTSYANATTTKAPAATVAPTSTRTDTVTDVCRLQVDVCDVAREELPAPRASQHLVLMLFVLSAIPPALQQGVLQKLYDCLVPGGKLLLRDYGRYDEAQLRFSGSSKLDENFYVRQDGTCAFYFDIDELKALCEPIGFRVEESYYIRRQFANRKEKVARYRIWVHMKLVK